MNIIKEIVKIGLQLDFLVKYVATGEKDMSILAALQAEFEKGVGLLETTKTHIANLKTEVAAAANAVSAAEANVATHVAALANANEIVNTANAIHQEVSKVTNEFHNKFVEFEGWLTAELGVANTVTPAVNVVAAQTVSTPVVTPAAQSAPAVAQTVPVSAQTAPVAVVESGPVTIKPLS